MIMEGPSWKQLLAVASFLAVLVRLVVRLIVPDYVELSGLIGPDGFWIRQLKWGMISR
jgi:hypothetical protein